MPKINFRTTLKNLTGTVLKSVESKEEINLLEISVSVLMGMSRVEAEGSGEIPPINGDQKNQRYLLAKRLVDKNNEEGSDGIQQISIEEAALLKKLIGEKQIPIIVGQCFEALDA